MKYRLHYPTIGAVKLHRMLENEGETDLPSAKTINNIIKRNGLITKEASEAATPCERFEKDNPNDMWQGYFLSEAFVDKEIFIGKSHLPGQITLLFR